jgi:hypothetical protein
MGRDLIKRYSTGGIGGRNLFRFLGDVYKTGKSREVVSFAIWEALHRLGWFPRRSYLQFNPGSPLVLKEEGILDADFEGRLRSALCDQGVDLVICNHKWKRLFVTDDGALYGYLDSDDRKLFSSTDNDQSIALLDTFPGRLKSVFVSRCKSIFVSLKGAVYRGVEGGAFEKVIDLGSPESFFRHSYAMTEAPDGTLIIGEYGNLWENGGWRKLANLYFSSDDGSTWRKSDFLIARGTNKHVHIVRYSPLLNRLLLADGDNKKKLWISAPLTASSAAHPEWKPITRFHLQTGGYTSVAESNGRVLFGTDYQGGTNFIVDTADGRKYRKRIVPDPYRRSPIHNLLARKSATGGELWANLPISTGLNKCLLMCSLDGGETWNKVIEYNSKIHSISLIGASHAAPEELYCSIKDRRTNDRLVFRIVGGA